MSSFCARQWAAGVGLTAGAFVVVAVSGLSAAHADTTPADPLTIASTDLTEASNVLSGIDVGNNINLASDVTNLVAQQNGALSSIGTLELAENFISAHDASLSSLVNEWYFDPLNQEWANAADSLLKADQGLATAAADGTNLSTAVAEIFGPESQLIGVLLDTLFTADAATLF